MWQIIIKIFWLLLPAGIANMSPVLFKWIPFLSTPINKRLFGAHKTYRGFVIAIISAILIVYIQKLLYPYMQNYSLVDYSTINILFLGFLLGFGAMLGDLVQSFFKRRKGIAPGKQWVPWDQLDWIIGALILVSFVVKLSVFEIIAALVLFGVLHPIINLIGYTLQIKKNKF